MKVIKSPQQEAATSVVAAVARSLEGKGGLNLEDCAIIASQVKEGAHTREPGYAPHAFDQAREEKFVA